MQNNNIEASLEPKPVKKESHQFRALFNKSATLQAKQIGTNICQIFTPIICLLFVYIIKKITEDNLNVNQENYLYPLPFNLNLSTQFNQFIKHQALQWYAFNASDSVDKTFLGANDRNDLNGFLGNAVGNRQQAKFNISNNIEYVPSPFFRYTENQDINTFLMSKLEYLNGVQLGDDLAALSDGAVYFKTLNNKSLEATLFINDCRNYQYHRDSGITVIKLRNDISEIFMDYLIIAQGQLQLLDILNSAYSKYMYNKTFQSGIIYMPNAAGTNVLVDSLINLVASILFPLSLSLLFPVFLYAIVLEKQQKLIQMMKMNGMTMSNYWLVTFIFNFFLSLLTNIIFFLFGYFLIDTSFFTKTSPLVLFTAFFGWILAQIAMSIFFQTFISKSRTATIIGYVFSIWTTSIGSSFSVGVYMYPGVQFPLYLQMFAPFGFTRVVYILLSSCSLNTCVKTFEGMPDELKRCIFYLYINFIVFLLLGMYLHEIIPQQFGVAKSIFFPIKMIRNLFRKKEESGNIQVDRQLSNYIKDQRDQDEDSRNQRLGVLRLDQPKEKYPLICNNLRKIYRKQGRKEPYAAVKSFNLIVQPNTIFGLLGPNGAGKTTLISIITGMFQPDNGNAWISGYSTSEQLDKAQLQMGVCPQFDLLWPQLTVEQHLYFYCRLKGIPRKFENQCVLTAIQEVNLQNFIKFKSRQLSGGMKRRLSVAISMVGNPKIVFLDQPTTGLDPDNRRQLWTLLSRCREKRAMFLTTHMMDQADTLCNRIGIITNGILRTVSNQITLKKRYGGGYRLDLNLQREFAVLRQSIIEGEIREGGVNVSGKQSISRDKRRQSIISDTAQKQQERQHKMKEKSNKLIQFMNKYFKNSKLMKVFNANFIFKLENKIQVSEIFEIFQKYKHNLGVAYWGVTNSSLEDVFMAVIEKYDKEELLQQDIKQSLRRSVLIKEVEQEQHKMEEISQSKSMSESFRRSKGGSIMST